MPNTCTCKVKNITHPEKFGPVCGDTARHAVPSSRKPGADELVCWTHQQAYLAGRALEFVEAPAAPALPLVVNG